MVYPESRRIEKPNSCGLPAGEHTDRIVRDTLLPRLNASEYCIGFSSEIEKMLPAMCSLASFSICF